MFKKPFVCIMHWNTVITVQWLNVIKIYKLVTCSSITCMCYVNSLPELLLAPGRRIAEYVSLLTWFQTYTPSDHADRADLTQAIKVYGELDQLINEVVRQCAKPGTLFVFQHHVFRNHAACFVLL